MVSKCIRNLCLGLAFSLGVGTSVEAGASIAPLVEIDSANPMGIIEERVALFEAAESFSCLNQELRTDLAGGVDSVDIQNLRVRVNAGNLQAFNQLVDRLNTIWIEINNKLDCSPSPSP